MKYSEEQIEVWKTKAEKWDALGKKIESCYCNKEGEYDEKNPKHKGANLLSIGEMAATAFRWI